jgi:small-conductance mechanosensitive channel
MWAQVATLGTRQDRWIAAILAIVLAFVAAGLVGRVLKNRGRVLAAALAGGTITPAVDTRLRLLRRLLEATIIFVGVFIAISQFDALSGLARSVLTSSAIVAAAIGLASRTTLANGVAGILLAVTQPLRVGDEVTFEGESGTVEDVRLTYTYLRDPGGTRVVIPNERLAMGMLRNHTVLQPDVGTEVSVWLAPEADALQAVSVLRDALPDAAPTLAEVAAEGSRVALSGESGPPGERATRENELRARAYAALRGAGLR